MIATVLSSGPTLAATTTPSARPTSPTAGSDPKPGASPNPNPSTTTIPKATGSPGPGAGTPAAKTTTTPPTSSDKLRAEEEYWTAERMAAAVPVDDARGRGTVGGPAGPNNTTLSDAPSGTPTGTYFDGMPMVGTFFYQENQIGNANTSCTGSVVRSAGKSMVLTAGHCADGMKKPTSHAIFVPQYRHGTAARAQPHGIFPVKAKGIYIDPRYEHNSKGAVSDLDFAFAFALVEPNAKGQVEDVTGALTFTPVSTYEHNVTVVGYPSNSSVNKSHKALRCAVPTSRLGGFRQMQMLCNGFYSGVSGGP
ncbi:trypsin-like serine peptidase [Streptomyces nojiriensis]|uniref:trypsin-like serine peptidase n=1 Tax=Streptomyces nojiriensis TaxID=66374 RepID=UPI00366A00C2